MSTAAQVNERLAKLTSAGVSVWLDQIRRSLIEGGELARMVEEESLRGVTANPSIFEKAILGSDDYNEDLESLAREQLGPVEIYERLAQKDVQLACDGLGVAAQQQGVGAGHGVDARAEGDLERLDGHGRARCQPSQGQNHRQGVLHPVMQFVGQHGLAGGDRAERVMAHD